MYDYLQEHVLSQQKNDTETKETPSFLPFRFCCISINQRLDIGWSNSKATGGQYSKKDKIVFCPRLRDLTLCAQSCAGASSRNLGQTFQNALKVVKWALGYGNSLMGFTQQDNHLSAHPCM